MDELYYKRGEFAKMNGVTLFALRLYDKLGILKPEYVADNGYHYYGVRQSQQLMSINLCVKAGFSLKEIRKMQQGEAGDGNMLSMLAQLQERLHKELQALEANERMARAMAFYHRAWEEHGLDHPFIQRVSGIKGFLSAKMPFARISHSAFYNGFLQTIENRMGHPIEYPLSFLLDCEAPDAPSAQMFIRTFASWAYDDFYAAEQETDYLILAFEGELADVPDKLQVLLRYADAQALTVKRCALLTPVQRYLFPQLDQSVIFVVGVPLVDA